MGNDFGWAVTQMLKGKEVRRTEWNRLRYDARLAIDSRGIYMPVSCLGQRLYRISEIDPVNITATDWEEYRPLPHAATPYTVNIDQAFKDVREFMTEISSRTGRWMPGMPGSFDLVRNSRIRMIFEEWNETATAIEKGDEAGELDGLVDFLYVIVGGAIETETVRDCMTMPFTGEPLHSALGWAIRMRSWSNIITSSAIEAATQHMTKSGLPVGAAWDEVHAANMRKFNGGHYDTEKGKWCKPEGWVGPDIAGILKRYPRKTNANQ